MEFGLLVIVIALFCLLQTHASQKAGIFGYWDEDRFTLPSLQFTFDELTDPRSAWPNSEDIFPMFKKRRDHFVVSGNSRLNVQFTDDGYVQLFHNERGPTWANAFSESQRNIAGGFSYLRLNNQTHCSAARYSNSVSQVSRTFGMGYFRSLLRVADGLNVTRTVYAPYGDDPVLISHVQLTNTVSESIDVQHYEFWDVNHHQLETQWIRTGEAAEPGNKLRALLNADFDQEAHWDDTLSALTSSMKLKRGKTRPNRADIDNRDWYPADMFLASLTSDTPVSAYHTDQRVFFGDGSLSDPAAVRDCASGGDMPLCDAYLQPAMLAIRSDVVLNAGDTRHLFFVFGYLPANVSLADLLSIYRAQPAQELDHTMAQWSQDLLQVQLPISDNYLTDVVAREAQWRSHNLLSCSVYHDYFQQHVLTQGSAYLYLHGVDGAPRDTAINVMAATYLQSSLAKQSLLLALSLRNAQTGQVWYAFGGHGVTSDALGLHAYPSDLDLALMLAIVEYVSATGDEGLLFQHVPYYPANSTAFPPGANGTTILDHIAAGLVHLRDTIGLGEHGLLRLCDGDWDDGVALSDPDPAAIVYTIKHGESIPNSQMALVTLPLLASMLERINSSLGTAIARDARAFADVLRPGVRAAFGGRWFGRAWLRNGLNEAYLLGNDQVGAKHEFISLQSQIWALVVEPGSPYDVLSLTERGLLLDYIATYLCDDSPIGPRVAPGDMVWPAISQWLTWGLLRSNRSAMYRNIQLHTYFQHSVAYPDQWLGIWAGPDGFLSDTAKNAGWTWASPVTPMTDYPVANSNPDAMFILGLARAFGIEPAPQGGGLRLNCVEPGTVVRFPLLSFTVTSTDISGVYSAQNDGTLTLYVAVPSDTVRCTVTTSCSPSSVVLNVDTTTTATTAATAALSYVPVTMVFVQGDRIKFTVKFS